MWKPRSSRPGRSPSAATARSMPAGRAGTAVAARRQPVDAQEQPRLVVRREQRVGPVAAHGEPPHARGAGDPVQRAGAHPRVDGGGGIVVGVRDHRVQQRPLAGREPAVGRRPHDREREHRLDDAGREEPAVDAHAAHAPPLVRDREPDRAGTAPRRALRLIDAAGSDEPRRRGRRGGDGDRRIPRHLGARVGDPHDPRRRLGHGGSDERQQDCGDQYAHATKRSRPRGGTPATVRRTRCVPARASGPAAPRRANGRRRTARHSARPGRRPAR